MAQKKTTGKKTAKKTVSSRAPRAKAVKSPPVTANDGKKGRAVAVLIIMVLISIIVFLVNRLSLNFSQFNKSRGLVVETVPEKTVKEEPLVSKAEDTGRVNDIKEKTTRQMKDLQRNVKVYFLKLDRRTEKFYLTPVERKVSSESMLKSSLEELVRGPGKDEAGKGYITAVPGGLRIRSIQIKDRSAIIDVSDAIEQNAAGDIILHRIDQIVYTATQFDTVDSVVLLINGRRKSTLGSDGLSVSGPLHRRR